MSKFSVLDIIQSLKHSGDLEKNEIILLTAASVSVQEIQKWIDMGVKHFLGKPFDPIMLFNSISNGTTQLYKIVLDVIDKRHLCKIRQTGLISFWNNTLVWKWILNVMF